jgi:RNA polymerase sigma factor (sigma-70 family)
VSLEEQLARAQRGDRAAFDELVRALHGRVFGYARRALGDEEKAVEVAQETFVRAWRYRASFDPQAGSARAWLFAIAANRVREAARARGVTAVPLDDEVDLPAGDGDALAALARGALRDEVARAVDALPPEQREVVSLKYLADLSYEEVARALGCSVGAAKMRALRARDALARALRALVSSGEGPVDGGETT